METLDPKLKDVSDIPFSVYGLQVPIKPELKDIQVIHILLDSNMLPLSKRSQEIPKY